MQGSYEKTDSSVLDPVCGMHVVPEKAAAHLRHQETDYYFCSRHCEQKFATDPETYVSRKQRPTNLVQLGSITPKVKAPAPSSASAPKGKAAQFICPMDPEVSSDTQGACPKCGMALEPAVSVPAVEYFCPMHPEVVSDRPGSCPICGMALEPRTVTAEEAPNPELADMSRRFWVGLVLGVPLFLLAMADLDV